MTATQQSATKPHARKQLDLGYRRDQLYVQVRRLADRGPQFGWVIRQEGSITLHAISAQRYSTMEAALEAGQQALTNHLARR